MPEAQDDELLMNLVELALSQPSEQREAYLRTACAGDPELFTQAWNYVESEERMQGFLEEPLFPLPAAEQRFETGELLDSRFRIVREIAQGGMGIVYEAHDEKLGRRIAIKCAKSGFRKRLTPEVLNASEITHPNVCRIFEIHTASTSHGNIEFLTMEFLDGETLTARLRRGSVPKAEARAIGEQIAQGLAEAHRHQVVHGDLKSHNVILAQSNEGGVRAVITDFGLARGALPAVSSPTDEGVPSGPISSEPGGTPDYMAPELWKGAKPSPQSDIFALGVILYELATGRRPYPGASWQEETTRRLLPTYSSWDAVLARCLALDPATRFSDAGQVAQALAPSRRLARWLAAAAAVVLAAGTGTIVYERATAPQESITLALLPLDANADDAALAEGVSRDAAAQLARLKGGKHGRLTVIPLSDVIRRKVDSATKARSVLGATHVVQGTIAREEGRIVLHAFLIDTRTRANIPARPFTGWTFKYDPREVRYAPVAIAGVAASTLRLPALEAGSVNAAAKQDYLMGLAFTRRDSTIDRALAVLDRAIAEDAGSPLTWAGLAQAQWFKYYLTNDKAWVDRASESLRQARLRNLDLGPVHRVNGRLLLYQSLWEPAKTECLRAVELDPSNADGYRWLAQAYEGSGQLDQALAAYQKAAEVDPTYFRVYQNLGAFFSETKGDVTEGVRYYETGVRVAPDEPDAHYSLGTGYYKAGRYVESERELRAAIASGANPSATSNLAYVLMLQGKDVEAVPVLEPALASFPDRYRWWLDLGDAYRRTNRSQDAARAYQRAFGLSQNEIARDSQDGGLRARLAYLCARLGNPDRAVSEAEQALQQSPEDRDARKMAAETYVALGKTERALEILGSLPDDALASASREPNLAGLLANPRFQDMLALRHIKLN